MKKEIHPQYFTNTIITCACGRTLTTGSTVETIHVELCSACHPFYTGKQKLVDTARRVEKFQSRVGKKETVAQTRKGRKVKRAKKIHQLAEKKAELAEMSQGDKSGEPATIPPKADLSGEKEKATETPNQAQSAGTGQAKQ